MFKKSVSLVLISIFILSISTEAICSESEERVPKVFKIILVDVDPEEAPKEAHHLAIEKLEQGLLKTKVFSLIGGKGGWVIKVQHPHDLVARAIEAGRQAKADKVLVLKVGRGEGLCSLEISFFDVLRREKQFWDEKHPYLESELSKLMEDYAFHIAEVSYADYKEAIFFRSLFVPGLGQLLVGKKIRGILYPVALLGTLLYAASIGSGNPYIGEEPLIHYTDDKGDHWIIGTKEVSREEWMAEEKRRMDAERSRDEARTKKAVTLGIFGTIYIVNLIDAILLGRQFDRQKIRRRKLSLTAYPDLKNSRILLTLSLRL